MQLYNKGVTEADDPSLFGDRAYYVQKKKAEDYIKIMDGKEMDAELGNVSDDTTFSSRKHSKGVVWWGM